MNDTSPLPMEIRKIMKASSEVSRRRTNPIRKVAKRIIKVPRAEKSPVKLSVIKTPHSPDLDAPRRVVKTRTRPIETFALISFTFRELKNAYQVRREQKATKVPEFQFFQLPIRESTQDTDRLDQLVAGY